MHIFVLRHGQRADNAGEEEKSKIEIEFDPHLTKLGTEQAIQAGAEIKERIRELKINQDQMKIVLLSSPFLRCLMTADGVYEGLGIKKEALYENCIIADNAICEFLTKSYFDEDPLQDIYFRKSRHLLKKYVNNSVKDGLIMDGYHSFTPKFPEQLNQILTRAEYHRILIKELVQKFQNEKQSLENIVVISVTHGYGVQAVLDEMDKFNLMAIVDYCSINQFKYDPQNPKLLNFVDGQYHAHLEIAQVIYDQKKNEENQVQQKQNLQSPYGFS